MQALASNSKEQLLALALDTAAGKGWKRLGTIDVGDGKLRIQPAALPGKSSVGLIRFSLPPGRYRVEYRPDIASSDGAQLAAVRLTRE